MKSQLEKIFKDTVHVGKVPISAIEAAESELGLIFPPSYRLFIETYGAAFSSAINMAGIEWPARPKDQCPQWSSVVSDTLAKRPDSAPRNSIAISTDGCEMTYHLVCSSNDKSFEGPVMQWGAGADLDTPFENSFLEFCQNFYRVHEGT